MKKEEAKTYLHDGKPVTIVPLKKKKKAETETEKPAPATKRRAAKPVREPVKYSVGDKVSVKTSAGQPAGIGFDQAVVIKVFKSASDGQFRYSVRASTGQEMALVEESQLKPRR